MAQTASKLRSTEPNIVSWALSGDYPSNRDVLIDACNPHRRVSKSKALKLIASLTGAFEPNSTVCLHLANDVLYPILCLAIYASHCRWTGTNTAYTAPELEHHFRTSQTKYVITAEDHFEAVTAAVEYSGTRAEVILFTDILRSEDNETGHIYCCQQRPVKEFRTLHDLLTEKTVASLFDSINSIDPYAIASLMSTSGTTGLPKMAARTHNSHVRESTAAEDNHDAKPYHVRRLYCTPIFHSFSTSEMVVNSLRLGIPSYFMRRYDDEIFPQKIKEFEITETLAPPPMILRLVNSPHAAHLLQSLRTIYTGGAPLVPELRVQFAKMFAANPPNIVQVWGMTEGGWFTTFKYPEADSNSVGRPLPGFEIKVGPNHRSTLCNGQEVGEIYVKSSNIMSGYWGNKEATSGAFDGHWLRTGDVGYINDGKVFLVDRAKDLIKVNGWQVSPSEIENALLVSCAVKDAAVIGVNTDVHEHPLAFVVLAEGNLDTTPESLKKELLQRLTRYKVASCEIRFIDVVPRSISGKILKNDLRRLA